MEVHVEKLKNFKPKKKFLIGIDSDGCVFDTMEIKQKKCFYPLIIEHFNLHPIAEFVKETMEFVNLYSNRRGQNRFIALIKVFDILRNRKEIESYHAIIPEFTHLKQWVEQESKLGNVTLESFVKKTGNEELKKILEWSKDVDKSIANTVSNIPPFAFVRDSLEKATPYADMVVISQTPSDTLKREWEEHNIKDFVRIIAGQEMGTKSEHLKFVAVDKYSEKKVLMIGDALGDLEAAESINALFYPIIPSKEEYSWERFFKESLDKFLNETYDDNYAKSLIEEFEAALPQTPPWEISK